MTRTRWKEADRRRRGLAIAVGLALFFGSIGSAQEKAEALEPVVVSALLRNPGAYEGRHVSLMGVVSQQFSPSAFSIGPGKRKNPGLDILILTPTLNGPVEPDTAVTIVGHVVRFQPGELAGGQTPYGAGLPPETATRYLGQLVVLATAVVNHATIDLTRRPPAAATAANGKGGGLKCAFSVLAAGNWVNGVPKVQVKPATLSIGFDAIDPDEGTARAIGEFSASDIIVRASEGSQHFMQVYKSGALYTTTVFDKDAGGGKRRAVHTRHEGSGITDYYGGCEATR